MLLVELAESSEVRTATLDDGQGLCQNGTSISGNPSAPTPPL